MSKKMNKSAGALGDRVTAAREVIALDAHRDDEVRGEAAQGLAVG